MTSSTTMRNSGSVYSRPTPVPKMPPGLVELMEGLSKDVLKHNPPDVYEFCANHMQKLLEIRDGPSQLKPIPLDLKIKKAQEIIRKRSERYWRNKKDAVEEKVTIKVLNPVHHDNDLANASEIEISCQPEDNLTVIENAKDTKQNKEEEQSSCDQNNKIIQKVLNDSTAVVDAKLDKSGDNNLEKVAKEGILSNEDFSVGNIEKQESIDSTAVVESKLDQHGGDVLEKDAVEAILCNDNVSVENIVESEVSKQEVNEHVSNDHINPSTSSVNTEQNVAQFVDQNVIENLENNLVPQKNIKDEDDIVDIQSSANDKAVNGSQYKDHDEYNGSQHEVVIKYTETEEDAENNSGVEIYITDDSEIQPVDDAVSIDNDEAYQRKEDQIVKNSLNIPNLTINEENLQIANDLPLSNNNDKLQAELDCNDSSTEKLVKTEQTIEHATTESPYKEQDKLDIKNTVFNIQDTKENLEHQSKTIEGINNENLNLVTVTENITSDLNGSPNDDKNGNKIEPANVDMKVNLKKSSVNVEEILVKNHVSPLSTETQKVTTEDGKISQDSQIQSGDPLGSQSTVEDKDSSVFIIKDPLEENEKQISEEDISYNSEESSMHKLDMISQDNLQTEIIAEIKEHLEEMVQPKDETNTSEDCNKEMVNEIAAPVDDSATEESNSINSVAEGGTTDRSDETVRNDITNAMDLETAAVTIQKVFRTFLFKSRASTFDESANDENNLSDDDNDDNNKDTRTFLPQTLNKDRRTLGISRMDTVLQTVNEEKSLSLSTDDSSTLSSAATVIQAHVRGFLVRNKLHSGKTASSTNSLINSDGPSTTSLDGDEQYKSKTILNIHIVPEGNNFLSRDESMITSMDLSLDGSPPSSVNLHPLGYDKISERRKQLKREDAIQSVSPPSNNSGKLSEDVESVKELQSNSGSLANASLEQETAAAIVTNEDINLESKKDSADTTPTNSITVETVIETNKSNTEVSTSPEPVQENKKSLINQSSDEMDVVTPYRGNTPRDSEASSGLLHSGEFHDTVLPTKVSRSDTPVVSGE